MLGEPGDGVAQMVGQLGLFRHFAENLRCRGTGVARAHQIENAEFHDLASAGVFVSVKDNVSPAWRHVNCMIFQYAAKHAIILPFKTYRVVTDARYSPDLSSMNRPSAVLCPTVAVRAPGCGLEMLPRFRTVVVARVVAK